MRISDWSSDVCSSDLEVDGRCLFDAAAGIDVPVHERQVGYVFQDARLFTHLRVRGILRYARRGAGSAAFAFDDVVALLVIGALLGRGTPHLHRKSVVSGKRVLLRIALSVRRKINKKTTKS